MQINYPRLLLIYATFLGHEPWGCELCSLADRLEKGRKRVEIEPGCGLISGDTAKVAGMATRKALTKWARLRDIP